ncbi:cytochrome c [Paraglaciecola aquimarina]|uniref:Cytochrome c n=1 Tax=Paraglaciecola algarum TaxID=3050085 RepID=A0ABS9D9X2_9ALTE|nr:cytochrome c [Paraglaciecola sp. G1-23]MCF2949534.1 cytochrome c [Paraglaciecola sp. G1-23]
MKKMKTSAVLLALAVTGLVSTSTLAADAAAGKAKSVVCAACHGTNGISQIPMYPNLAGQKEQYLVSSLKAFRDGQRKNMIMAPMAANLSDADIENLAAYYAKLDPAGK